MAFNAVYYVECGGCRAGFLKRDNQAVPHIDCNGTGLRVPKKYGRPVKAASRRGQASPWVHIKGRTNMPGKKRNG